MYALYTLTEWQTLNQQRCTIPIIGRPGKLKKEKSIKKENDLSEHDSITSIIIIITSDSIRQQ